MLRYFIREESGQTTVEYLLIIAVIVVGISVLGKGLKDNIGKTVNIVFQGVIEKIRQLMKASTSS